MVLVHIQHDYCFTNIFFKECIPNLYVKATIFSLSRMTFLNSFVNYFYNHIFYGNMIGLTDLKHLIRIRLIIISNRTPFHCPPNYITRFVLPPVASYPTTCWAGKTTFFRPSSTTPKLPGAPA